MAKHPKCEGYKVWTSEGYDYDCGYGTTITCDECRYCDGNNGRGKDPAAECNRPSDCTINRPMTGRKESAA